MNYSQTLEYLFTSLPSFQEVGSSAYKPGLDRIKQFCKTMGNPQRHFFTIHVAGTNGKGSTSHMIASVLQEAGYCVGLYTSPHLVDFRERIKINGAKISKRGVVNFVDKNRSTMEQLELSFFEMTTALAFDYFANNDVEIAVIETGLGGRLDATNVIMPILSVITNVAVEHTAYLGSTLPQIAREKGGIIKKSIPVVVGERNAEYDNIFVNRADELNSPIVFAQDEFSCLGQEPSPLGQSFKVERHLDRHLFLVDLDLSGSYQCQNLITATAALDYLHLHTPLSISRRAFLEGMKNAAKSTALKGRWQSIGQAPLTICDTAHNPHGLRVVVEQIAKCDYQKLYCVVGFASDKELSEILPLLPTDAYYIFTKPNNDRMRSASELKDIADGYALKGEAIDGVAKAVARAKELATADDMIFIGGSNFVVAEI